MNVVYLISSLKNGGPVNMLYTLVKYITQLGCNVTIIALKKISVENTRDFSHLDARVIVLNKSKSCNVAKTVQKIVDEEKADIVHSHGGKADSVNTIIKGSFERFNTIHCSPDKDCVLKYGKILGWIKASLYIYMFRKINYPIACSETVSNDIEKTRHFKVRYVRNGIDQEMMDIRSVSMTRAELMIPDDAIVYLFCGYLSRRKNVGYICEAFKAAHNSKCYFIIIGDGGEYEKLVESTKDEKNIIMTGRLQNPFPYYSIADVFVSASLSEGLPMAVMEGMSYGLSPLLSDIDSHREIKACCSTVELFSLHEMSDLISVFRRADSETVQQKGVEAKKAIDSYLNAQRMAKEYYDLYLKSRV